MKLLKQILIINKRFRQKLLLKNLHKWNINIYTPCIEEGTGAKDLINNESNKIVNKNNIYNNNTYKNKISNNKKLIYNLLNQNVDKKKNIRHSYKDILPKISLPLSNINKISTIKSSKLNRTTPNFLHNFNFPFEKRNINRKLNTIKKDKYKTKNNKNKSYTKSKDRINKDIIIANKYKSSKNDIKIKNKSANNKKQIKKKKINDNIIKDFIINLTKNGKNREEKMLKLNNENEEKINSIYTFSPKLISNKNNQKYYKTLMDKFFINNIKANINNKISNNTQTNNNYEDTNNKENQNQLDIVLEENRKNINYNFISRLYEYEKRKKDNLEKIKNEVLFIENQKSEIYNNTDKYNIEDFHLLNSTYSYFFNKKRNIEKLMKDIDDEKGITFRPKLNNDYNKKIIKNYNSINNEEYINKKNNKIFDYLSNKDKECTFHPKINNSSNTNELNVSERLFGYQNKYKQKLDLMRSKYGNFTFRPEISKNTNIILNKKKLIHHLKEEIKNNCSDSSLKLLLNKKEEKEKDYNLMEESKNDEYHENNENKLTKFNVNIRENIKANENEIITPVIVNKIDNYSENKEKNNLDNKYHRNNNNNFHLNDFKIFINNIKNKDNNKKNNKKIMDFCYYNKIV